MLGTMSYHLEASGVDLDCVSTQSHRLSSLDAPWASVCSPNTSTQVTSISVSLLPCFSSFSKPTAPMLAPATRRPFSFSPASIPAQGPGQRPSGGRTQGHVLSKHSLSPMSSHPNSAFLAGPPGPHPYQTRGPSSQEHIYLPDKSPPASELWSLLSASRGLGRQCKGLPLPDELACGT